MINMTPAVRLACLRRQKAIEKYASSAREIQLKVLSRLVSTAAGTAYGCAHGFGSVRSYADFAKQVPVNSYEELKGDIERMRLGAADLLWKGKVRYYARSSGTTADRSKFIPVSDAGLKDTHYAGGFDSVALYFRNYPDSRLFSGKGLILGGSFAPEFCNPHSKSGDLSAILIDNVSPFVNLFRVPSREVALLSDFEKKRDLIARAILSEPVTNLSGVPSWMMSVLNRVLELSGKDDISEVWPMLEVFFHGGVAFTPYRERYKAMISSPGMHYMETYNASEGFFGIQDDPLDRAMLLMIDYGVFYEFIPMDGFMAGDYSGTVPLWGIEPGVNYAMVITTSGGLWRYLIGDTVIFTSRDPYKFIISGRTKNFINALGEEVIVDNAEKAVKAACEATGADVREYTAAPLFAPDGKGFVHQWLVEFRRAPASLEAFTDALDKELRAVNSDYDAKRSKDIVMQKPQVLVARENQFDDWLASRGKLGGQHKIPRLCNDRKIMDELLNA